ncbi:tigger transposable element-derived protein 6-like [Eupeodes corollae]|uniref:tigger transposable element-derived protein 6-like n=1 Tax=Eupeodes corollae TaxID=290404 RepID=UPI002490B759|nr:tigger transposable element-derived protein 6-like [Eupeodes corollae]
MTPNKTLKFKGKKCNGGKMSKERITVLVGANMTGTVKQKLQLGKQKEQIQLLVDNCPAHPKIDGLTSMKLVFLPLNTTSVLQPMDQGIIRSLKEHYRKLQKLNIIRNIENQDGSHVISLLDAILLISRAWERVSMTTIKNCFKHGGFIPQELDISIEIEFEEEDNWPLSPWVKHIQSYDNVFDLCNFVTAEFLINEQIIDSVQNKNVDSDENEEETEI